MTEDPIQSLIAQLETVLALLDRPIVQRQLLVIGMVVLVAWLISERGRSWLRVRVPMVVKEQASRWQQLELLYLPLLILLLIYLTASAFAGIGWPSGLLRDSLTLFVAFLGYRVTVMVLSILFGYEVVYPYQRRLLLPIFLWFIIGSLLNRFLSLDVLAAIEVTSLFGVPITLGRFVTAVALFYLFIALAWATQGGLQNSLAARTSVDPGVAHAIVTIGRYTLVGIGLLLMLSTLGLDLSTFALIGGGLSVGIGFGLQQIVANFISGILLQFEQSLRPGDVIEIGEEIGTVEKLSVRSTVVRTNDNVEMIIPNEQFLTTSVTTYTRTNRLVRISVFVGVGYDSDPEQVREILLETAVRHNLVLAEPAPSVFFVGMGASSLDFRLAVWIRQPQRIPTVRSDLLFMIWNAFQKHNITIPFPQRDLNLGTGWEKLLEPTKRAE